MIEKEPARATGGDPAGSDQHELLAFWQTTVRQADAQWRAVSQRHTYLGCRSGCARCCHSTVYITAIDAAKISEAYHELPEERRAVAVERAEAEVSGRRHVLAPMAGTPCPLLREDQLCGIYEKRPLICRLHGYTRLESNGGVNMCPENAQEVARRGTAAQLPVAERPLAAITLAQASRRICTYLTIAEAVLLAHQHGVMTPEQVDTNYRSGLAIAPVTA